MDVHPSVDGFLDSLIEGLSVRPDTIYNLPPSMLPKRLGGEGRLPVFSIRVDQLGDKLRYQPDFRNKEHGFIVPVFRMKVDEFQEALVALAEYWSEEQ